MLGSTIKRIATAAGVAALLGVASTASADPLDYMPANTGFKIKFINYENLVSQPGDELFGLINVTQILSSGGLTTYWNGNGDTDGMQLVGFFENLIVGPDQTGGTGISFAGGNGALYLVSNGTFSPSTSPDTKDFANQLCGGSCSTPWLTFDFVPGINDTINGDATLQGAMAVTNVNAGFGYLSVTGGIAGSFLDTNGFLFNNFDPADMSFKSNFSRFSTEPSANCDLETSQGWSVCSDDPLIARSIPEPGIVAMLGLGALIAGSLWRRKAV